MEGIIGDPKARSVVVKAIATLRQVGQVPADIDGSDLPVLPLPDEKQIASSLIAIYNKLGGTISSSAVEVIYTSSLVKNLIIAKNFEVPEWDKLAPYLAFLASSPEPITVAREWVVRSATKAPLEIPTLRNKVTLSRSLAQIPNNI